MKMSVREDIICRLCLNRPHNGFVLTDETLKQGLEVLMVKMNFDVSNGPLMCDDCVEDIKRSLSFILVYLNSEKSILLFDTGEDKSHIDLRDVYTYNSNEIVYVDTFICRFCIKKVEGTNFIPLNNKMKEFLDLFKEYTFNKDENIVKNFLICFHCRDNIESYITFLWRCFDTEQKIDMYKQNQGIRSSEKIMLGNVFQQFSNSTLAYPNMQVYEIKKEELSTQDVAEIKISNIFNSSETVKEEFSTEDEEINNSLPHQITNHMSCSCDVKDNSCLGCRLKSNETVSLKKNGAFTLESEELHIKDEVTLKETTHSQSITPKVGICICNKSTRKTSCSKCNSQFDIVSTAPNVYKCKMCPYQGVQIILHMLKHRDKPEETMYKCMACDFKTKNKSYLKYHSLVHKTEAEVTTYKCTACDFKTIRKNILKKHLLIHKSTAELTMYKCTACDFKTKHKHSLKYHSWTHKTEAELIMYKCTVCDFKTRYKTSLKKHSVIHKTEAEVTMYKCVTCDYKAIRKSDLKSHFLNHKSQAEIELYECADCSYRAIRKQSLITHSMTHKTDTESKPYKCAACDFKTVHKYSLKIHSLIHKTERDLTMYKCTTCDYRTKYKKNLKRHSLTHKTEAELTMYKCTACDYKTIRKGHLKLHSLIHKSEAELTMYKCEICNFKTKHKRNLKGHSMTHLPKAEVTLYKSTRSNTENLLKNGSV